MRLPFWRRLVYFPIPVFTRFLNIRLHVATHRTYTYSRMTGYFEFHIKRTPSRQISGPRIRGSTPTMSGTSQQPSAREVLQFQHQDFLRREAALLQAAMLLEKELERVKVWFLDL